MHLVHLLSVLTKRELKRLNDLFQATGKTQDQVASRLGWSQSKISRILGGEIGIDVGDLRVLLSILGSSPAEFHASESAA
jgi:transcriptional regulator with XRE-family HTH domain